jgi:selenium metabolism protein YedF
MVEVNCIGQKCPLPLINTKKALVAHPTEDLLIKVDNETSCTNLRSYLADNGIQFTESFDGSIYTIVTGEKPLDLEPKEEAPYCTSENQGYIVVLDSNEMGRGDAQLGAILLKGFLTALSEADILPQEIICYNSGVLIAASNSPASEYLKKLHSKGVKVTLCGTCVDFYQIKQDLAIGEISNMLYILGKLSGPLKIVKP